jgi:ribosomal-protein-alanine N-acetyltransferase
MLVISLVKTRMSKAKIRIAVPDDIDTIQQVSTYGTVKWAKNNFANVLQPPNRLWVATISNQIAAFLITQFVADEIEILNIVVADKYRKQGVATALLEEMLLAAKLEGSTELFLEVSLENHAAIAFYEKFEFFRFGERKNYYADGSSALLMKKVLN